MVKKEYEGSVYVGVVGSELDIGVARDSIGNIVRRNGDSQIYYARGTKGIETRELHINSFLDSKHDFILMLDGDMLFPEDTLERLRSHKLPYVSGIYMRRHINPITPVWFKPGKVFPLEFYLDFPDLEPNKLYDLGASGWGCVLVHRDVFMGVKEILKGEPYVHEDDMDVYPYDLGVIMASLKQLKALVESEEDYEILHPAYQKHIDILIAEIRPLRADKSHVGSDIRFPFYARMAGYQLQGDPNVRCGHYVNYPLTFDDYLGMPEDNQAEFKSETNKRLKAARREITKRVRGLKI